MYCLISEIVTVITIELYSRGAAGASCTLQNGVGFLAFSSDGSNDGVGFRAHVVATTSTAYTVDSVHFFNKTREFTYPTDGTNYQSFARALSIFQSEPGVSNTLQLTYLATEADFDFVHFFTIYSYLDASDPAIIGR